MSHIVAPNQVRPTSFSLFLSTKCELLAVKESAADCHFATVTRIDKSLTQHAC